MKMLTLEVFLFVEALFSDCIDNSCLGDSCFKDEDMLLLTAVAYDFYISSFIYFISI